MTVVPDELHGASRPVSERASSTGVAQRHAAGHALQAVLAVVAVRIVGVVVLAGFADASGTSAYHRLAGWDAQWYMRIARDGYGYVHLHTDGRMLSDYAFFPLYPALERMTAETVGVGFATAGLIVAWLSTMIAAWGIYALADHLYGHRTGILAAVLWAAVPVGTVESMAYGESLFTALAAWSLYAVVTERWIWAGTLAALAGLARPIGVAVAAAVVIPAVLRLAAARRGVATAPTSARAVVVGASIAPTGWLGYLGWVAVQTDDPAGYFGVAEDWGNGFDGGLAFLSWIGGYVAGGDALPGLLLTIAVASLIGLLALCVWQRQPLPLVIFAGAVVLITLTSSGYFGSKPRYLLPAFPLLLPIAAWLAARRTAVSASIMAVLVGGSAVYGAFWLLGPGPP
jgi:Dolichyl-phosphate-mannose-protein mannosyltransferase